MNAFYYILLCFFGVMIFILCILYCRHVKIQKEGEQIKNKLTELVEAEQSYNEKVQKIIAQELEIVYTPKNKVTEADIKKLYRLITEREKLLKDSQHKLDTIFA